jgi:hypothetical protein
MTDSEWQNAVEPHVLLEFLQSLGRPRDRELRLFAVACSRRIWSLIDDVGRGAVDAAEEFADARLGSDELRAARLACQGTGGQTSWYAAATNPAIAARNAARSAQAGAVTFITEAEELLALAILLREIFGNPFRRLSVHQSWQTPDVVELAQAIYYGRAFDRMSELSIELEKAGCNDAEVLSHCRAPSPHVRGCWALDFLLDRRS